MSTPLKPGYKQTEVGVIPEEWEVRPLLTTIRIANGQVDPRDEPYRSMVLVAPDHIESQTGRLIEKKTAFDQRAISGKYLFEAGDLLYSKIRPYLRKVMLADFRGLCSADMYPLTSARDVAPVFMLAELLGNRFSRYAESVSVRSGMPKINREELAQYFVALPTLSEQRAIAEALGDVDALLGSLSQLIAKKRDLKQAAMQQLLTGQQRLPGFTGQWEESILSDKVIKVGSGITPTGGATVYLQSGRPFIRSQNVGWGTLLLDDIAFIDDQIHETFASTEIQIGDVLLNITGASIGRSAIADARVKGGNVNQHVCIIRPNEFELDSSYLNYFLLSTTGQRQIDSFQAGGNRQGLNFGQIRSFRLYSPKLPEQTAIAAVLSDMDAEITALEQRLEKANALKQGMMQELLTGRIRLV